MRAMERIGILLGVFAFTMATIYGLWTSSTKIGIEWVGVIGLILGGLLGFMIAWYLWMTRRRLERDPSDDPLGDIDEIQGEYGFFSPHSWWPLFLGLSAGLAAVGFAVGWWLFLLGACFTVLSAIGFVFEYYRGDYAH